MNSNASQLESLAPQLVNAGRIRMTYPESKAADEHFENLRQQYADTIQRTRALCDEATDSAAFIKASEDAMKMHTVRCENAIADGDAQKMVDNTAAIARLANRVILVAKQECDNSEDPAFIQRLSQATEALQNSKALMEILFYYSFCCRCYNTYYLIFFRRCTNGPRCQKCCHEHKRSLCHFTLEGQQSCCEFTFIIDYILLKIILVLNQMW